MRPDPLLEAARSGDVVAVTAVLHGLSEAERRRLAPHAMKFFRGVREAYIHKVTGTRWEYGGDPQAVLDASRLLVFATVTPSELRKVGSWGVPSDEVALQVLKDRRAVASALVDAIAEMPLTRWVSRFHLMRSAVSSGIVQPPASDGYILAMVNGLAGNKGGVLDALRADPGLLEHDVWRLFEVEGAGDTSLAAHDKYTPEAAGWARALKTLSEQGNLSRTRLLRASLAALGRDFAPFRAGWFSRFHELLSPTREERQGLESEYVTLLASPVPATVSFAVRALLAGGGVSEANVDRLAPALMSGATSTVNGAIKLLPKSDRGAAIAAAALPHATRDGQEALRAFINRTSAGHAPEVTAHANPARRATPALPALKARVESLPDLIELLVALVEHVDDAHDIERALDGVSRLCDREESTLRRLEAVSRRAVRLLSSERAFAGESPRADIAGLVTAWATGRVPPVPRVPGHGANPFQLARRDVPGPRKSVLGFLSSRVLEIASRAARGDRAPILSLPTRHGGAIDPEALQARRTELSPARVIPGPADATQAALRAGEIKARATVRFVFESQTATTFQLIADPPVDDGLPGLFIGAISAFGSNALADYCGVGRSGIGGLPEAVRWVGTVWPANRELFYAKGAAELGRNVDWWQAMWHVRCFLQPLLLPGDPIGEMGTLLLAIGLGAKEPGEHALATDVFIRAVDEHRLDASRLGETLGKLYDHRVVKGSRLANALTDGGRISPGHGDAAATALERALAEMHGPPPADLHAVLTALADALAIAGRLVSDPDALAYLAGIEGAGKAAAQARKLVRAGS